VRPIPTGYEDAPLPTPLPAKFLVHVYASGVTRNELDRPTAGSTTTTAHARDCQGNGVTGGCSWLGPGASGKPLKERSATPPAS